MAEIIQNPTRVIFGMIGTLIGAIPVTILKYTILFSKFDWLCTYIGDSSIGPVDLILFTCGLVIWPFWVYLFFILFGGALFGFLSGHIWVKSSQKQRINPSFWNWEIIMVQSLAAGLSFDLLFVFIFIGIP